MKKKKSCALLSNDFVSRRLDEIVKNVDDRLCNELQSRKFSYKG